MTCQPLSSSIRCACGQILGRPHPPCPTITPRVTDGVCPHRPAALHPHRNATATAANPTATASTPSAHCSGAGSDPSDANTPSPPARVTPPPPTAAARLA